MTPKRYKWKEVDSKQYVSDREMYVQQGKISSNTEKMKYINV